MRIVNRQVGEQNFHVFYQIICGASDEERDAWNISPDVSDYILLASNAGKQGEQSAEELTEDQIEEYKQDFMRLKDSLKELKFEEEVVDMLFSIIAGLLHLGQVQFDTVFDNGEEGCQVSDISSLELAASLCGFSSDELVNVLTNRTVTSRSETFSKKLSKKQSIKARDAIAKIIYKLLFSWLTKEVNLQIKLANKVSAAQKIWMQGTVVMLVLVSVM